MKRYLGGGAAGLLFVTMSAITASATPGVNSDWLGLVQTLSLRLRLHRLESNELRALEAPHNQGESRRIYEEAIHRWMDRNFYARLAIGMIPVPSSSSLFIDTLRRFREAGGQFVYYLPHTVEHGAAGAAPCDTSDRAEVTPWWSKGRSVSICRASYRPETTFDAVGYCAGQPEPLRPIAPRAGCGCGPFLLACLPPQDEAPQMKERLLAAMTSEISVTGAEILSRGGSFDELMTTSRTWQTGLDEFLYVRRDMLALAAERPYSPQVESRMRSMLTSVDIDRPGRWVDRKGVYKGSGLFLTTPLMGTFLGTSRASMTFLLSQFLCTDFPANHVDSEALIAITHGQHEGVRFEVYESPMRNHASCSGCHAPMDYGAGFMVGLRAPLYGSIPTSRKVSGRLYVNGAGDFRGEGDSYGALSSLVVRQPEFSRCMVMRMFTYLVGRPPRTSVEESDLVSDFVRTFEQSGRRIDVLSRAILLSEVATEPVEFEP